MFVAGFCRAVEIHSEDMIATCRIIQVYLSKLFPSLKRQIPSSQSSTQRKLSMPGKVNSPRSQWHCSNWDICSVWQGGGQIVESCG